MPYTPILLAASFSCLAIRCDFIQFICFILIFRTYSFASLVFIFSYAIRSMEIKLSVRGVECVEKIVSAHPNYRLFFSKRKKTDAIVFFFFFVCLGSVISLFHLFFSFCFIFSLSSSLILPN